VIKVVGVGDNTVDKYLHLGMMFPGGNAVNVPVLAKRYGHQGSYIGCIGEDIHGELIAHALKKEGIDISHCRFLKGPNAFCEVNIQNGERVFGDYTVGVRDQLNLNPSDLAFIQEHDITHTSIYSALEGQLASLRNVSSLISFDFSSEWDKDYLSEILPLIDVAILSYDNPSQKEVEELIHWVKKQGPTIVIHTQGERGAYLYDGKVIYHQPAERIEVLDSLGAGDAFIARFLVEHFEGASVEIAMQKASQSAAETCKYYGAFGHGMAIK